MGISRLEGRAWGLRVRPKQRACDLSACVTLDPSSFRDVSSTRLTRHVLQKLTLPPGSPFHLVDAHTPAITPALSELFRSKAACGAHILATCSPTEEAAVAPAGGSTIPCLTDLPCQLFTDPVEGEFWVFGSDSPALAMKW